MINEIFTDNINMSNNTYDILHHNFDDIKESEYFENIKTKWDNLGFTKGITSDKADNLVIAFEQLAQFIMNGCQSDVLDEETNNFFKSAEGSESFEITSFAIFRKVYDELPYSEYDFKEILEHYAKIQLDDEIKKNIKNCVDPEAEMCCVVSKIICDKIRNK